MVLKTKNYIKKRRTAFVLKRIHPKMHKIRSIIPVFCLLFFLSTNHLSAQTHFAIKGGLNAARITHDANIDHGISYYSTSFWHLGLLANYKINDRWSIQPELLYSRLGGDAYYNFQETSMDFYEFKQTLSYVKMPIIFGYTFDQVNIEAGPGIGYLLSTKISKNTIEVPSNLDIFDQKIDLNINAGIKYTIKRFFTQLRWQYSVIPIAKVNFTAVNGTTIERVSFYSSVVQVSFGLRL